MERTQKYLSLLLILTLIACNTNSKKEFQAQSRYYTDSIYSQELKEYRKHDIYLPQGFDPNQKYTVLFAADGQFGGPDDYLKRTLDSLIEQQVIPPLIYAGSHSNSRESSVGTGQDKNGNTFAMQFRFFEYVESEGWGEVDPALDQIFQRHMNYFSKEFIPAIESEFGQSPDKSNRLFYGVSNGAGFGANLLNKQPELIDKYILYSTLGSNANQNKWDAARTYPDLYLKYGTEEAEAFREEAEYLQSMYQASNSKVNLEVYQGGHEEAIWKVLLPQTLGEIFKLDNSKT